MFQTLKLTIVCLLVRLRLYTMLLNLTVLLAPLTVSSFIRITQAECDELYKVGPPLLSGNIRPDICRCLSLTYGKGIQLVRDERTGAIYLPDVGGFRHIVSIEAFNKYHFSWKVPVDLKTGTIDAIKKGRPIL